MAELPLLADHGLFSLDVLPARSAIEAVAQVRSDGRVLVRFRASRLRGWFRREQKSEWSGWFEFDGEPICLRWATFWMEVG